MGPVTNENGAFILLVGQGTGKNLRATGGARIDQDDQRIVRVSAFFFGGLVLSYLLRTYIINKYLEVNKKKILLWTVSSGALNGVFWFFLLMLILFPNYLFQIGIISLI